MMVTLRASIELQTAFGTPLAGDTLFGQLCWAAREQLGGEALGKLLQGYTEGQPWLVVSDGFPSGYLPKPGIPHSIATLDEDGKDQAGQRKTEKSKRWLPLDKTGLPLKEWMAQARTDKDAFGEKPLEAPQPHNTINRFTSTTGNDEFAPYTQPQTFYLHNQKIDLYLMLDEARLTQDQLSQLLHAIGSHGYGRDASIGLGKFTLSEIQPITIPHHPQPTAYLTLAPCAPQGQGMDGENSFWRVITRFGRHGNRHGISEKPFKNPVLLAATGAVFVPLDTYSERAFIGQGLGGEDKLSKIEPATVQQGYAPVVGIELPRPGGENHD